MILQSTLVKPYYRQNVGFYLLIYLLAFGFLRQQDHLQICGLIVSKMELLFGIFFIWMAHVLKTLLFVNRTLHLPTHQFLRDFAYKSNISQWKELFVMQFWLNLPFLSYGCFMVYVSILNSEFEGLAILLLMLLGLSIFPVFWLKRRFKNFARSAESNNSKQVFHLWPSSSHFWFLRYLLAREPFLFFSTKFFSFLIIMGLARLYPTDDYDYRLIYLSAFFAGIAQFVIGKAYQKYLVEDLWFTRNLAFSRSQLITSLLLNTIILSFFEILILFRYLPADLSFSAGFGASFLVFSFQFFWLSISYFPNAFGETFSQRMYLLAALFMLMIMFSVPYWLLGGVLVFFGSYSLLRYYDLFEIILEED